MNVAGETVFVVDDDESLCSSLEWMLSAEGLTCETFRSGEAFLDRYHNEPGCLLLDVRMRGMGGRELQEELGKRGAELPIIFVSGHADVPIAVNAMRAGAIDVIEKPFDKRLLIDRILSAFERDRSGRELRLVRASLEERIDLLAVVQIVANDLLEDDPEDALDVEHAETSTHKGDFFTNELNLRVFKTTAIVFK